MAASWSSAPPCSSAWRHGCASPPVKQTPFPPIRQGGLSVRLTGRLRRGAAQCQMKVSRCIHGAASSAADLLQEENPHFYDVEVHREESFKEEKALEQQKAPVLQTLMTLAGSGDAPFHFPGHKRGAGAPSLIVEALGEQIFRHDLPELPELDNLFAPEGVILEAQENAARTFGANKTFFLVNGSTVGVQAAVMATCPPGKTLVLPRNAHQSAVSAMIISGAQPHYILPKFDSHWNIPLGIDPESVRLALQERMENAKESSSHIFPGEVGAVLIVSPTYHGACSDIEKIAKICHEFGVPLIVDEAHGAHFKFHDNLPKTALEQGADFAVQSTHKVLGSLTQSAMLHVRGKFVNSEKISRCLQLLQSSSPSYVLLASIDAAAWQVREPQFSASLERGMNLAAEARKRLAEIPGIEVLGCEISESSTSSNGVVAWDLLRVTVGTPDIPLNGYEVDDILRLEHGVVAELPSLNALTFAFSFGTTLEDVGRLVAAYESLSRQYSPFDDKRRHLISPDTVYIFQSKILHPAEPIFSPREAFFTEAERVPLTDAVGRLSAELLCPYPPGVPVLLPGESVSEESVQHLKAVLAAGGSVSGAGDPSLETIAVLKSSI